MHLQEFFEEKRQFDNQLTKLVKEFVEKHGINPASIGINIITIPEYTGKHSELSHVVSEIIIKA